VKAILGLIFAAIGVYVGVNLLPGLNTTVATITTPTYSAGVAGLIGVVMIVFAAMRNIVASRSNPSRITGLKRGNLSLQRYGNPVLSGKLCLLKCVETIYSAPHVGGEIVQYCLKK